MTVYVAIYTFETNYKCVVQFVLFLWLPKLSRNQKFLDLKRTVIFKFKKYYDFVESIKKKKKKTPKQGGLGEERWLHGLKMAANSFPLFLLSDGSPSPPLESGLALWPSGHSNVTEVTLYNF